MEGMEYFGLGIIDRSGIPFDPFGINDSPGDEGILALVEQLNHDKDFKEYAPFRAVRLFYKDEQSPCAHHHTCGTWDAEKQEYEKWICLDCKKDLGADYYTKKQAAAKEQP